MAGGTVRVVATITGGIPRTAINVWHAELTDDTVADAQGFVDAIRDFYTTAAASLPSTVTVTVGTAATLITSNPPVILGVTPRVVAGTGSGGAGPAQLAQVASWRTAFAGKSFRGRTYLGPVAVSATTGGIFSTPVTTSAQNAANALIAASSAAPGWTFGVWSEKLQALTFIGSGVVNSKGETQRRRNR